MRRMRRVSLAAAIVLTLCSIPPASAQIKDCEELKTEIAAKLDAKGVKNYSLEIVAADAVGNATVVGSCAGGAKRITYTQNYGVRTATNLAPPYEVLKEGKTVGRRGRHRSSVTVEGDKLYFTPVRLKVE